MHRNLDFLPGTLSHQSINIIGHRFDRDSAKLLRSAEMSTRERPHDELISRKMSERLPNALTGQLAHRSLPMLESSQLSSETELCDWLRAPGSIPRTMQPYGVTMYDIASIANGCNCITSDAMYIA